MPVKKMRTRKPRRYRNRKNMSSIVNVSRGVSTGFPPMFKIKHRYVETGTLTSTAGAIASKVFRANGMFDPYVTHAGHQPYYFDQMGALYNHYTVIGSKIKWTITGSQDANVVTNVVCHINDDSTLTPTSMSSIQENRTATSVLLGYDNHDKSYTIVKNFSLKKAFGKQGTLANSLLRGSSLSDPTEQQCFFITIQAIDAISNTQIAFRAEIEYIAVWNELKDISGS